MFEPDTASGKLTSPPVHHQQCFGLPACPGQFTNTYRPRGRRRTVIMFHKTRLFTPGPTPLLPSAQFAMAAADLHHRTAEFRTLYSRVLDRLKQFIGTTNDVVVLASSGTGAMEAAVSNLTSPGDKVLVLTAGKFGERWTSLAKAFQCDVTVLSAPYGQTFSAAEIKAKLTPDTKLV